MKHVIFKKLSIQNFLSIGNSPVVIEFNKGLNIITGENLDKDGSKNGVGKSTICDAINFCLFGDTLRELKKPYIRNRLSTGPCKVILAFDVIEGDKKDNYVLMRGIDPTTIQLLHLNSKTDKDITKSSIPKTTHFVQKLINCSPEVFQQSILMSVNSTLPFMAQKKVEKRKFIEGVLKLSVFSELLNRVRLDYTETKKEHDTENKILTDNNNLLEKYKTQQENIEFAQKQQEENLRDRISKNLEDIETLKSKIVTIDEDIDNINSTINLLKKKEKQYESELYNISENISTIKHQLNTKKIDLKYLQNIGPVCDSCKRPFTDEDKQLYKDQENTLNNEISHLSEDIKTLTEDLKKHKDLIDKCKNGIDIYNDKLHQIDINQNNNNNIKDKISHIQSLNKQIERDIKDIYKDQTDFRNLIEDTVQNINNIELQLNEYKNKLDILESAKFVVSEEGVKSFIVKKILQLLNQRMAIYLTKLDANCRCTFNEYFEETIIDDKGHECSYHNFSGGEKKRIDLAMLFTFQDIRRLQGDVIININIYDELLDSSLDGKGVENVIRILKERIEKYDESIYIITHNSHAMNTTVHNTIHLVKYNGITKLKE